MEYIFSTIDNRKWKYLLLCTFTYLKIHSQRIKLFEGNKGNTTKIGYEND